MCNDMPSRLASAFRMFQGFMGPETLATITGDVDPNELIEQGLIQPGKLGRWLDGYKPAGEVERLYKGVV